MVVGDAPKVAAYRRRGSSLLMMGFSLVAGVRRGKATLAKLGEWTRSCWVGVRALGVRGCSGDVGRD